MQRLDPNRPAPTMLDFDKKLTETDAYLQILIDQVKDLETRIEKVSEEHEKMRLCNVRDRVNEMLESIKHTIVQLQIAKVICSIHVYLKSDLSCMQEMWINFFC